VREYTTALIVDRHAALAVPVVAVVVVDTVADALTTARELRKFSWLMLTAWFTTKGCTIIVPAASGAMVVEFTHNDGSR
jgi:hypothetical protein